MEWSLGPARGQSDSDLVTVRFGWKDGRHGGSGELAFRLVSGRMECVGVRLGDIGADHAPADGGPLPTDVFRHIPWGSITNAGAKAAVDLGRANEYLSRFNLRSVDEQGRPIAGPDLNAYVARMAPLASAVVPTRGRPDLGDDHYREVARVYLEAWNSHDPAPTVAVAQTFRIPKTTAAKRVVVARRRGYLGPAVPRRAGV